VVIFPTVDQHDFVTPQSFLNSPPLAEDPERFDRTSDISLSLPGRERKKGRWI
jgi:hypothetical protein